MSAEFEDAGGESVVAEASESRSNDEGAPQPAADRELLVGSDSEVQPTLSVVMPTLDEEDGIEECIRQIRDAVAELGLTAEIIVSDSSTDRTPEIARELGAIVVTPDETGYGNAYKYAFQFVRGEYVAIGDADTTYDFRELPSLVNVAIDEDADMVIGSRFEGEIRPGAMPALHRYVGNPLLTKFLNTFYEAGVSDAHSGMRVIRTDALRELDLKTGGMEFASEMIMAAAEKEMHIEEVPITYHQRVGEAKLDSFSDGWRHVKFMLTNAPGYLFTLPAFAFALVGVVITAASIRRVAVGPVTFGLQTLVVGVLFALVAYQVGSLALFSSIAGSPIRRSRSPIIATLRDRFTLEGGATLGVVLTVLGGSVLGYSLLAWGVYGYDAVPEVEWNLLAAVTVVLGVQTIFNAFFLSILAQHTE